VSSPAVACRAGRLVVAVQLASEPTAGRAVGRGRGLATSSRVVVGACLRFGSRWCKLATSLRDFILIVVCAGADGRHSGSEVPILPAGLFATPDLGAAGRLGAWELPPPRSARSERSLLKNSSITACGIAFADVHPKLLPCSSVALYRTVPSDFTFFFAILLAAPVGIFVQKLDAHLVSSDQSTAESAVLRVPVIRHHVRLPLPLLQVEGIVPNNHM
jgi:hypothetical protein